MTSCTDSWQNVRGVLNSKWTGEVNISFPPRNPPCLPFNTIIRRCFCIWTCTLWSLEEAHCGPGEFRSPLPDLGLQSRWIWERLTRNMCLEIYMLTCSLTCSVLRNDHHPSLTRGTMWSDEDRRAGGGRQKRSDIIWCFSLSQNQQVCGRKSKQEQ